MHRQVTAWANLMNTSVNRLVKKHVLLSCFISSKSQLVMLVT